MLLAIFGASLLVVILSACAAFLAARATWVGARAGLRVLERDARARESNPAGPP